MRERGEGKGVRGRERSGSGKKETEGDCYVPC